MAPQHTGHFYFLYLCMSEKPLSEEHLSIVKTLCSPPSPFTDEYWVSCSVRSDSFVYVPTTGLARKRQLWVILAHYANLWNEEADWQPKPGETAYGIDIDSDGISRVFGRTIPAHYTGGLFDIWFKRKIEAEKTLALLCAANYLKTIY